MKKFVPLLGFLFLFSHFAWAQSNDLHVNGYVTDQDGMAVAGQWVCVQYSGSNPAIEDSVCANTNDNGWYSIVIENGSVTGPNETFEVYTLESCNNTFIHHADTVMNAQGSVDVVDADFQFTCDNNTGGGCNCEPDISYTFSPNDSVYQFMVDVPCGTAPYQYQWWIDGQSSAEAMPSYVITQDGAYGVGVTVSDANGCSLTAWDTLFVGDTSCSAYWYYGSTPNGNIEAGESSPFYFSGSASNTAYFGWTVQGNGLSLTSEEMNPSFTFPAAGTYNVCLTVIDSLTMCYDDYCADVVVTDGNNGGCQAYFTALDSSGYSFFLNNSQGNASSWDWDFGDGNTSNEMYPAHLYDAPGTYVVCLTISTDNCQDTYCDTVVVSEMSADSCDAYFTGSGPTPIGYTFSAAVQSNLYSYEWSIDNQVMPNNGVDLYVPGFEEGTYTICLTMSSDSCSDTYCETIVIEPDSACNGVIYGQVFAGVTSQPVDVAIVYLITYDDQTGQLAAMQATTVDSMGYYAFQNVACGEYLVKAATTPNSTFHSGFLPTYYGNSLFWENAQEIVMDESTAAVPHDVILIAGNNPGGPGFIGGNVLDGANKMEADGEPLEGINVMLFDLQGNVIAYTYTDENGEFAFDNLAYGGYQVYAELLNYTTVPAVVTISAENPSAEGLNIYVSDELISTGIVETDYESLIGEVYPNPANDLIRFNLDLKGPHAVTISILDLAGRTVASDAVTLTEGLNTQSLSVDGLGSGYYMLNIRETGGAFNITRRFIVNR